MILAALVLFLWSAPTTYVDDSPLLPADIESYRLSWSVRGVIQPDITVPGDALTYDLGEHLGRVCVTLRTVVDSIESDPSTIACRKVKPRAPEIIEVTP